MGNAQLRGRQRDRAGTGSESHSTGTGRRGRFRLAAVGTLIALAATACGNNASEDQLDALLNDNREPSSAPEAADETSSGESTDGGVTGEVAEGTTPEATPTPVDPEASPAVPTPPAGAAGAAPAPAAPKRAASAGDPSGSRAPAKAPPRAPAGGGGGDAAQPAPGAAQPSVPAPPSPGGGEAPPAAPASCSGSEKPIIIGSVGTMSGVVGYLFAPGAKAVSAWAAEANQQGGVGCHKIKHLIGDSGGDPARYQSLIRQFVEREGVVTFVFNPDSFAAQAGVEYLEEKQIPVVGGGGGEMFTYEQSMQFPVFAMGVPMQINQAFQASRVWLAQGKKKIGTVSCVEAEYCPIFDKTIAEWAPKLGFEVVYQANVTITAPDYTANCLEARNAGVQAFITSLDGQTNHRFINSCAKVGFDAPLAAASIQGTDDFKDNPSMVGSLIGMNVRPWFSTHPSITEHRTIFKKHIRDAIFGPAAINGWTTAKAFESAVRRVAGAGKPVGAKEILAGLYALNGDDLGGLTYPLRFSPDQPKKKRIACGWPVQVVAKGKWTMPIEEIACVPGLEP